jgi:hypothetical protein
MRPVPEDIGGLNVVPERHLYWCWQIGGQTTVSAGSPFSDVAPLKTKLLNPPFYLMASGVFLLESLLHFPNRRRSWNVCSSSPDIEKVEVRIQ